MGLEFIIWRHQLINYLGDLFTYLWSGCAAHEILVPKPGLEPKPPALEAQSLNLWTTREVPLLVSFHLLCFTNIYEPYHPEFPVLLLLLFLAAGTGDWRAEGEKSYSLSTELHFDWLFGAMALVGEGVLFQWLLGTPSPSPFFLAKVVMDLHCHAWSSMGILSPSFVSLDPDQPL